MSNNRIQIGASTACLYPMETEKSLEEMGRLGVRYVEIFYNSPSEYQTDYIKKLKKILDHYGIEAISMHPYDSVVEPFMFFTDYERRFHDALDQYRRYFDQMNLLDSKFFVFHGDRYDSKFPEKMYFERFGKLNEIGQSCGITVVQENVQRCKSREPRFIQAMSRYLGDQVSFVLDLKQAVRGGVAPFEMLDAMKGKLKHLHFNDHDQAHDCLLPGRGDFDFVELFQRLEHIDYEGYAMVEVYRRNFGEPSEIIQSIDFLKETEKKK